MTFFIIKPVPHTQFFLRKLAQAKAIKLRAGGKTWASQPCDFSLELKQKICTRLKPKLNGKPFCIWLAQIYKLTNKCVAFFLILGNILFIFFIYILNIQIFREIVVCGMSTETFLCSKKNYLVHKQDVCRTGFIFTVEICF